MSVEVGTHRNGERFAKVWLSDHGINATVEGVGVDDDAANRDMIGERTKAGMARRKAQGMPITRPKLLDAKKIAVGRRLLKEGATVSPFSFRFHFQPQPL